MGRTQKREINVEDGAKMAAVLLGQGMPRHVVRACIAHQWRGRKMSGGLFESIESRAREILQAASGKTGGQMLTDSLLFYAAIVADQNAQLLARVRARQAIDRLYGLSVRDADERLDGGSGDAGAEHAE